MHTHTYYQTPLATKTHMDISISNYLCIGLTVYLSGIWLTLLCGGRAGGGQGMYLRHLSKREHVITLDGLGAAAYQLGNTSSRTITEVKQC